MSHCIPVTHQSEATIQLLNHPRHQLRQALCAGAQFLRGQAGQRNIAQVHHLGQVWRFGVHVNQPCDELLLLAGLRQQTHGREHICGVMRVVGLGQHNFCAVVQLHLALHTRREVLNLHFVILGDEVDIVHPLVVLAAPSVALGAVIFVVKRHARADDV